MPAIYKSVQAITRTTANFAKPDRSRPRIWRTPAWVYLRCMDYDWALTQLGTMRDGLKYTTSSGSLGLRYTLNTSYPNLHAQAQIVDQVLDRVVPDWRTSLPENPDIGRPAWQHHRTWVEKAIAAINRREEVEQHLGELAPGISASRLHPWVWDSASVAWSAGSYGDAVRAAARAINAKARQKLGRKNLSEWKLLSNAFSPKPPAAGEPRLRLMPEEESDTFTSLHLGAGALAQGLYMAVRNPSNHEDEETEIEEHIALEQLAGFSLLARFVNDAVVERV